MLKSIWFFARALRNTRWLGAQWLWRTLGVVPFVLGLATGCSLLPWPEAPDKQAAPAVTSSPAPTPKPKGSAPPAKPPVSELPRTAILYGDDVPMYARVAEDTLARLRGPAQAFAVSDDGAGPTAGEIGGYDRLVAVGALAARHANRWPDKPLVFCQVFNYQRDGLDRNNARGVSMLPPAESQLKAWKTLVPGLRRIGTITGPGHEQWIEQARSAAGAQGMVLVHRIAQSDKETLYQYKRLVPEIDGLWLLPDDRILSHRVLRELMSYSARHNRHVLAFSPELLKFGALLSASSVEADVAAQVAIALQSMTAPKTSTEFRLYPLTEAHIETNDRLARGSTIRPPVPLGADGEMP